MNSHPNTPAAQAQAEADIAEAIAASTPRDRGSDTGRAADEAQEAADLAAEAEAEGRHAEARDHAADARRAADRTARAANREYPQTGPTGGRR